MKITIETIAHSEQRYPTVGDWFFTEDWHRPTGTEMGPKSLWQPMEHLHIRVSSTGDWRHEALVAVHELVEVLLCKHAGVSQEVVDRFNIDFEKARAEGLREKGVELGDAPEAPYRTQHCVATGIERILAANLGVNWTDY